MNIQLAPSSSFYLIILPNKSLINEMVLKKQQLLLCGPIF